MEASANVGWTKTDWQLREAPHVGWPQWALSTSADARRPSGLFQASCVSNHLSAASTVFSPSAAALTWSHGQWQPLRGALCQEWFKDGECAVRCCSDVLVWETVACCPECLDWWLLANGLNCLGELTLWQDCFIHIESYQCISISCQFLFSCHFDEISWDVRCLCRVRMGKGAESGISYSNSSTIIFPAAQQALWIWWERWIVLSRNKYGLYTNQEGENLISPHRLPCEASIDKLLNW